MKLKLFYLVGLLASFLAAPPQLLQAFNTVINVPPSTAPSSINSSTQLNLLTNGQLNALTAGAADGTSSNIEINVSGGLLSGAVTANGGTIVNFSGGSTSTLPVFTLNSGSALNVSGGTFQQNITANSGSTTTVSNGTIASSQFTVRGTLNVTGGLVSPITLDGNAGAIVNISGGTVDIHSGNSGSTFNISGGTIWPNTDAASGSVFNISGGTIDDNFNALSGSTVNVSGGLLNANLQAFSGSTLKITGGNFGTSFESQSGSNVRIAGGAFGDSTAFRSGGATTLVGSEFRLNGDLIPGLTTPGSTFAVIPTTGLQLSGTFTDGTPFMFVVGSETIETNSLKLEAATLPAIGPSLIIGPGQSAPLGIRTGQSLQVDNGGVIGANFNAGRGSMLIINSGGSVGQNLEIVHAEVDIAGGTVGNFFDAYDGAVVNMTSGLVGGNFKLYPGATFNLSGGSVGASLGGTGAHFNISGGSISSTFSVGAGSDVKISGGSIFTTNVGSSTVDISGGLMTDMTFNSCPVRVTGGSLNSIALNTGSTLNMSSGRIRHALTGVGNVNITGGTIDGEILPNGTATINVYGGDIDAAIVLVSHNVKFNLFGTAFYLDGVPINLQYGVPHPLSANNQTLTAILADGSPFDMLLDTSSAVEFKDSYTGGLITVTLVPEPATILLALPLTALSLRRPRRILPVSEQRGSSPL